MYVFSASLGYPLSDFSHPWDTHYHISHKCYTLNKYIYNIDKYMYFFHICIWNTCKFSDLFINVYIPLIIVCNNISIHVYDKHVCSQETCKLNFFAKEASKRDYILQKRPILLRSLLIEILVYDIYVCSQDSSEKVYLSGQDKKCIYSFVGLFCERDL